MTSLKLTRGSPGVQCYFAYLGLAIYHLPHDPVAAALYGWLAIVALLACNPGD